MRASPPHLFAAAVLAVGGGLVGITALGIVVAKAVLDAGIPGVVAKPTDVALLGDLVAVLPFVVTFAAINIAAAIGLVAGRPWAVTVASWAASAAVAIGLLGLVLLIAGSAPATASGVGAASDPDGLAIVSVSLCLYAAAAVGLRVAGLRPAPFAPSSSAA